MDRCDGDGARPNASLYHVIYASHRDRPLEVLYEIILKKKSVEDT